MVVLREAKHIEHITASGVVAWITPLAGHAFAALQQRARELHPDPDKAAYEEPHPDGIDGAVIPAEDNPNYVRLKDEAERARNLHVLKATRDLCVQFPIFKGDDFTGQYYGKDELMDYFADRREQLSQYFTLPADTWEATYTYCILSSPQDAQIITQIATDQLPVMEVEVAGAMRLFRPYIQRNALRVLSNRASNPPGVS